MRANVSVFILNHNTGSNSCTMQQQIKTVKPARFEKEGVRIPGRSFLQGRILCSRSAYNKETSNPKPFTLLGCKFTIGLSYVPLEATFVANIGIIWTILCRQVRAVECTPHIVQFVHGTSTKCDMFHAQCVPHDV